MKTLELLTERFYRALKKDYFKQVGYYYVELLDKQDEIKNFEDIKNVYKIYMISKGKYRSGNNEVN